MDTRSKRRILITRRGKVGSCWVNVLERIVASHDVEAYFYTSGLEALRCEIVLSARSYRSAVKVCAFEKWIVETFLNSSGNYVNATDFQRRTKCP